MNIRYRRMRTCSITAGRMLRCALTLRVMAIALVLFVDPPATVAQLQRDPRIPPIGPPVVMNPQEDDSRMGAQMRQARNAMRQKKMVSQMQLLQKLTEELRADVDKTGPDGLPPDVVHKSEQIEKLARSIRELMIGPL
jgi:hypothetical protein